MQGDRPQQGYELLTHLRRLETRIARLQKRWHVFRADPRPERLEEFRKAFAVTDRALEELALQLGSEPATSRPAGPIGGTDARAVVDAGRTLDHSLAEINRAWGFLRRDPDLAGLDGLADRLAKAEAAAAVLGRALPSDTHADADAAEPAVRRASIPAAGSLDSLLSRIRDDWESLRRSPAPDRAGVLRGELSEARRMAEALRSQLATGKASGGSARYLTGMEDAVRFAPYRDAFTGLYNREGFDALAGAELKRCRRYSRSFGLILIETQAEQLAELRRTIGTMQSLLRGYDLVSRYSDRMLAVGLPETEGAETRRIAARLLRALEGDGRPAVRRLAYALMPDDGATLANLIGAAQGRLEA